MKAYFPMSDSLAKFGGTLDGIRPIPSQSDLRSQWRNPVNWEIGKSKSNQRFDQETIKSNLVHDEVANARNRNCDQFEDGFRAERKRSMA